MAEPQNFRAGTQPAKHQFSPRPQLEEKTSAPQKTMLTDNMPMANFKEEIQPDGTYKVTLPSGREMLLRPLPPHFYMIYGQLPDYLPAKAFEAVAEKDKQSLAEIVEEIPKEDLARINLMMREAVKYICVKPQVSLEGNKKGEISLIELSVEEYNFLNGWAIHKLGVEARSAASFRRE